MANARAGKWAKIWVEGYKLTTRISDIVPPHSVYDEVPSDGYTQDHNYTLAQADALTSLNGFFDETTNSTHDALKTLSSGEVESLVTVAYGDNATPTIGDITSSAPFTESNYNATPTKSGIIAVTATFKALGTAAEWGVLLADLTSISIDGNTSSVNNGALSSSGGAGYLHITAVSASDTIIVKIQDSTNNTDWDDLITFTLDGSAIGAERIEVSGTVNQYLRVLYDVTGTGVSFDFAVAFNRK